VTTPRPKREGAVGPRVAPSFVDVVLCRLDLSRDEIDAMRGYLSPDERGRADRLISERARDRFVVGRGRLRQLLGPLCGRSPEGVRFSVAAGGKPRLDDDSRGRLRFNVAHSNDLMVCAVTLDQEVGIDVEYMREDVDCAHIAARFFARDEVRSLAAVPPPLARAAFFTCWTRKEAVIKATGDGMARPLASFVVSVDPGHAAILSADPGLGRPEEWTLIPLPLPPGYQGTVAARATITLRVWFWPAPWAV
jgi:4'-phosphopantetheinyl transferase